MTRPPAPGLADRLRDGSATAEDRTWAVRRLGVLREDGPVFGLTPAEKLELGALTDALEGDSDG